MLPHPLLRHYHSHARLIPDSVQSKWFELTPGECYDVAISAQIAMVCQSTEYKSITACILGTCHLAYTQGMVLLP